MTRLHLLKRTMYNNIVIRCFRRVGLLCVKVTHGWWEGFAASLGLLDYCPKHNIKFVPHGYDDIRHCHKCWDEGIEKLKAEGKIDI